MKLNSLDKSLQIIEILCGCPQGAGLSELTKKSGFPNSTIHHMLSTFLPYDYVSQDPETKKYHLGFKFLNISNLILNNIDIRKIAHKYLLQLHAESGEAVHLAVLRNGKVVYVDKINKSDGLSLATYIGFYTDPHAAAGGRVLLSQLATNKIMEIYQGTSLKKYSKNTITNFDQLLNELRKVKKQGYAIDDEEYYEGVRCVAAPIKAGGKVVAAVSITCSIFTLTMERINKKLKGLVVETAEKISSEMHW